MTQQTQTYRERSRSFLAKAREELLAGDLEQASEKAWGAAALMVKAIAERREIAHQKHRHLFQVVDVLVEETGDRQLNTLFAAANGFHTNFYEDWFSARQVGQYLDDVADFVTRVERLLPEDE
jgi:uncharacterized protein (UPF0332 family)